MGKIKLLLVDAGKKLERFAPQIEEAARMAEEYAVAKLKVKDDVDVVASGAFYDDIIPEIGVGGHAYRSDFVTITLDARMDEIKTEDVFQMLCHELAHAARWQHNDEWTRNLLDYMMMEGLAVAFEIEAAGDNLMELEYFAKMMVERSDEENERILELLSGELASEKYDVSEVFYVGNEERGLPRWAGYSAGYYIVRRYLEKSGKLASEAMTDGYEVISEVVESLN